MLAPGLLLAGLCLTRATPELGRVPAAMRLAALGLASIATALAIPGNDLSVRQETGALEAAAAAIRASGPSREDKLYVVNRGAWLYGALELPPPTKYFYPGHTLCDFRKKVRAFSRKSSQPSRAISSSPIGASITSANRRTVGGSSTPS